MKLVSKKLIGLVIALVIAWFVTTWYLNNQVQHNIESVIQQANINLSHSELPAKLVLNQLNKGLLTSTAEWELQIQGDNPLTFKWQSKIEAGLFPWGRLLHGKFLPVAYYIISKAELPEQWSKYIKNFDEVQKEFISQADISLSGKTSFIAKLPKLLVSVDEQTEMESQEIMVDAVQKKKGAQISAHAKQLVLQAESNQFKLDKVKFFSQVQTDLNQQDSSDYYQFQLGFDRLIGQIPELFKSPIETQQGKLNFEITPQQENLYQIKQAQSLQGVALGTQTLGNYDFSYSLNRISPKAATLLLADFQRGGLRSFPKLIEELKKYHSNVIIGPLKLGSEEGRLFEGKSNIGFEQSRLSDQGIKQIKLEGIFNLKNIQRLTQKIQNHLKHPADRGVLSVVSSPFARVMLGDFISKGLLQLKGDEYSFNASVDGSTHQVILNGKTMTDHELMNLLGHIF